MNDERYVIWSIEHQAWWAPDECGYVPHLIGAGVYDKSRALAIVNRANVAAFHECAIPIGALNEALKAVPQIDRGGSQR